MKKKAIGVKFRASGKMYYFDPLDFDIQKGDAVIVITPIGEDYGQVVLGPHEISEENIRGEIFPVVRKATPEDEKIHQDHVKSCEKAEKIFNQKVKEHHLKMRLIDVQSTFDGRKIIFYYTADGRVDFRDLVKDLASYFHARIELRQIGVRDEARKFGSIGICGRQCCCSSWLNDFVPATIKMAKEQNLSLNSTKISGICGRLLCCLNYEQPYYEELSKNMPELGQEILTPEGRGFVYKLRTLEEVVLVKLINEKDQIEIKRFTLEELEKAKNEPEVIKKPKPVHFPGISEESQKKAQEINDSYHEPTTEKKTEVSKKKVKKESRPKKKKSQRKKNNEATKNKVKLKRKSNSKKQKGKRFKSK